LFDVPDLANVVDEEANHLVLYTEEFDEKSEMRQCLSRNLVESQRRLSILMGTIYELMDVLFEAVDESDLVKNVHIDHNFAMMLQYAAEGSKDVRRSEVARNRAMSAHQAAYRLEQRVKTACKRAKARGVDDHNVTERAVAHCRSMKTTIWDRYMAADRSLTRRKEVQGRRENVVLKGSVLPALVAAGRFKQPRSSPDSDASSTTDVVPSYPEDPYPLEGAQTPQQGDSIEEEPEEISELWDARRGAALAQLQLNDHRKAYCSGLLEYLYLHPSSDQKA
jgi:hypothetical protein